MTAITIDLLDESEKEILYHRAIDHGISIEAEAKQILLKELLSKKNTLVDQIHEIVSPLGGIEIIPINRRSAPINTTKVDFKDSSFG